jgi:hydrogenase maturation protease
VTVLVAGVGNLLRGDDGFGVVVAERLVECGVPDKVRVIETGIGGIHLVQELMSGVRALIVVDAVNFDRVPGTVLVVRPDILDVARLPPEQRRDQLADVHYSTPERAFMLARALGVLPAETWIVGCQPTSTNGFGTGLHASVSAAVEVAAAEVRHLVRTLGVAWQQ